jgi:hypothetical protein
MATLACHRNKEAMATTTTSLKDTLRICKESNEYSNNNKKQEKYAIRRQILNSLMYCKLKCALLRQLSFFRINYFSTYL